MFDIVLMNPPYDRDLHIDFIRKCIDMCDTLINISPGGFINNIGMYSTKKKSHDIIKHLKDVEFLSVEDSNKYFGLGKNGIKSELHIGVYEHDYTDGKSVIDEDILNVYKKIRYTCKTNLRNHFINKEKFGKYGVRIFRMHYDRNTPYYDNIICTQGKAVEGIDFKTENEKNNFIKSIHTWVYEFMFKLEDTNPAHLPYLDDYTKEWTDERLYKLFDITEDDKKVIKRICDGKKFDIVLMNPPYSGSLHLKFLNKTIEIADNVVSIQPTRWLQDTLATYKKTTDLKKYKESIAEHINNLEFISADDATKYFGANFTIMVGIYNCSQNKSEYYKTLTYIKDGIDYSFVKKIIEKIIEDKNYSKMNIKHWNKDLHNFVPLNNMTGENIKRCKPTNVIKEWTKPYKNGEEYEYDKKHKSGVARGKIENDRCLVFDTYEEAKNCYDSFTKCNFTRFYMSFVTTDIHIYHEFMPFMSDYTKPWTDERFYKYFDINKDEQKIIENYAEKIWNRLNGNKRWDICLMNPPYGAKEDGNYLDIKFTNKCIEICDKVISIQPAKLTSNAGIYKTFFDKNIVEDIELLDPYNTFKINPFGAYKYVGIFNIDPNRTFNKLHLTLNNSEYNIDNTFEERSKFINEQNWDKNIRELIDKKESLRKELFKKYNSMVNDGHGFIYEENRLQRGKRFNVTKKDNHALDRVKQYLKDDKYKYCIYKGSGNNSYDKPQEWLYQDVDKLFKGQVCWLTNSENVKDNIIYWMETPIFDLWRLYYFNHSKYTVGCMYGHLPALDFEMNKEDFKDYVDSLNNFTKEEIQILKDNNIHNADEL